MQKQPEPVRKKPRRYTAEPQQVSEAKLVGVFELPHGAGRPRFKTPGVQNASDDSNKSAEATSKEAEPVFSERAAEDDPRRWGDSEDDLGEWMKSQRPPHWD